MSGGVDSSVALLKVIEMGFDPIGVTMKLWSYDAYGGNVVSDTNCCSTESINGAKLVCDRMDVPHYTIDFTQVFKEQVVDDFANEYLAGRTPNPCVRCNSFVKWEAFIRQAEILGAEYIATGHYARIETRNGTPVLKKGLDPLKDQAYVLWGIPRQTLKKTILPLGDLSKSQVRSAARSKELATADTPESMEICFIPDNDYKRFLNEYRSSDMAQIGPGEIIENGQAVGTHSGYVHFTIGQRKGLGLSRPEPRYVTRIEPLTNRIFVGPKESLLAYNCTVENVNWLVDQSDIPSRIHAQIRYNSPPSEAALDFSSDPLRVSFFEPRLSITPGQSIVFYDDDIVLGGGVIARMLSDKST